MHTQYLGSGRHYPRGLGEALVKIFKVQDLPADLRGKPDLPQRQTDRELFENTPLGDCWWDADLPQVFFYLMENKHLKIPESWHSTMMAFKEELKAVPGLYSKSSSHMNNINHHTWNQQL